jgi:hypothetical protein
MTLRQRTPRQRDEKHLSFIRQLPCLVTGRTPVEAAHVRYADVTRDKPHTGKGEKPDDRFAVPLHWEIHREQHSMGERDFWERQGIDPVKVALLLHGVSGDVAEGEKVIRLARLNRKLRP